MAYKAFPTGPGLNSGKVNVYNDILVEVKDYVSGKLTTEIDGPSRVTISYIDNHDGTLKISYKPTIPGDYTIVLKLDTFHLPGSPFRVKVKGLGPIGLLSSTGGSGKSGYIRSSSSLRPATFNTSADYMWINKPTTGVKLTINGANPNLPDYLGKTPIETARFTI
ncbi:filamin-A-like [Panonychus citri]|uniref:filamin-A-like n=1 Tax=Panonychus citri TaxID=50023 RepID=UPI0023078323|nr:filamin-A-like [Panonychus citri]